MTGLAALPVVGPLAAAALLAAARRITPRPVNDVVAIGVAIATVVIAVLLAQRAALHPFTYWVGGWRPRGGIAVGIGLSIDSLGAGLAAFAALLVTAALVYAWRYFEAANGLFHALMLVFLGAMAGFTLTGDLFDMLVFFELMGTAAYALTALRNEERAPIQGAINFAISNSLGAYAIFIAIALLYARTGALNLAQIGTALSHHAADPLVIVAFVLLLAGFLTKAALVPLHFWLADAHAVAPAPVSVLFSGVMVELGLYAVARIYWTAFAGSLHGHGVALTAILLVVGTVTAAWGAIMCVAQRHLKRLLAFSTISHMGLFLCGIALLRPRAVGAVAVFVVAHGLTKAALFMLVGVLLHRFGTVDEYELHGRGRVLPITGTAFAVGGLMLAAVPVCGAFFGKSLLDGASIDSGHGWLVALSVLVSILTSGAVLRVAGRIFLGWGPSEGPDEGGQAKAAEADDEERVTRTQTPVAMVLVPAVLLVVSATFALVPGVVPVIERAGGHLADHAAMLRWALHGVAPAYAPLRGDHLHALDFVIGTVSAFGAIGCAALGLFGRAWRVRLAGPLSGPEAALHRLRALHSGHVGDYTAWWTAGVALIGAGGLLVLR